MSNSNLITGSSDVWSELDENKWKILSSATSTDVQWFGKWSCSQNGYLLLISDGIGIWGENRCESYIVSKSQEWAACLECGVKELCNLVLSQLHEDHAELKLNIEDEMNEKISIELTALLDQLPYNWVFYLSKLSNKVVERHLTLPLATSLQLMSERIKRLEAELQKKTLQLEEFVSAQNSSLKRDATSADSCIDNVVARVVADGASHVLCSHLAAAPNNLISLVNKRKEENDKSGCQSVVANSIPHNRPKFKKDRKLKGAFNDGVPTSPLEENNANESKRRAAIEAINRAPISSLPKRKKLHI